MKTLVRRSLVLVGVLMLLAPLAAVSQSKDKIKKIKGSARYKSVEVKHFTRVEGVELPPEFDDFLYAELRLDLQKTGLFEQIAAEDEALDPSDAPRCVLLEGTLVEYKKGSSVKKQLTPFGLAGTRS